MKVSAARKPGGVVQDERTERAVKQTGAFSPESARQTKIYVVFNDVARKCA